MPAQKDRLYADVQFLTDIRPFRNHLNLESLSQVVSYIRGALDLPGFVLSEQKWMAGGQEYTNVVATWRVDCQRRLIVGAHYDVCGDQPGADDNASAVAGLLETARLIAERKPETGYAIELVAYCLEEPPYFATNLMGSYIHAQSLHAQKADVIGMICYEMIGYFSDLPHSQPYPSPELEGLYPHTANFIIVVGIEEHRAFNERVWQLMKSASTPASTPASAPRPVRFYRLVLDGGVEIVRVRNGISSIIRGDELVAVFSLDSQGFDQLAFVPAAGGSLQTAQTTMSFSRFAAPPALAVGALAAVLTFAIFYFFPFLGTAERWTRDFRIANLSPAEPQHPDIVVAAIVEDTLAAFPYRSPVDRKFLADTITTIAAKGARAILLDVLLDQETEPEKDEALQEALAALKIPLAISYSDSPTYVTEAQLEYLDEFVKPEWRGLADIEPDKTDGIIRFVPPPRTLKDGTPDVPNVAARLAQKLGAQVPMTQRIIAWRGEPDRATEPFRSFPAHAVRVLPEAWFKDKIVLIGADLSLTDRYRTPFSVGRDEGDNRMAGIVIQAHILAQMLEGRVAPEERAFVPHLVTLALMALVGAALGGTGVPIWARLGGATLAIVGLWAAGWYLFRAGHPLVPLVEAATGAPNVLVPLIEPVVALGMALWLADAWSGREERQQKKFIQGVFSKYASAELLNEIVKDPKKLDLSASRRPMSLIFTAVQGFTTL